LRRVGLTRVASCVGDLSRSCGTLSQVFKIHRILGHSCATMSAFAPDDVDLVQRVAHQMVPRAATGGSTGLSAALSPRLAAAVLGRRSTYRWVGPGWSCCSCCCPSMLAERKQEERSRRPPGVRGGSSAPSAWGRGRRCARGGGARWGAGVLKAGAGASRWCALVPASRPGGGAAAGAPTTGGWRRLGDGVAEKGIRLRTCTS
jgi:hypothetical protein